MLIEKAIKIYLAYLKDNTRPNTVRSFSFTLNMFQEFFSGREMADVNESNIIEFISDIAGDCSPSTKNSRVGVIRAFYNFIIEVTDASFANPCHRPMIRKLFKCPRFSSPKLLDKDLIDEIIFRTTNERDRLILELMGRSGMRVGEVLNIRHADINFDASTILITEPKSGRKGEKVFITKKLCGKLQLFDCLSDGKEVGLDGEFIPSSARSAAACGNTGEPQQHPVGSGFEGDFAACRHIDDSTVFGDDRSQRGEQVG